MINAQTCGRDEKGYIECARQCYNLHAIRRGSDVLHGTLRDDHLFLPVVRNLGPEHSVIPRTSLLLAILGLLS